VSFLSSALWYKALATLGDECTRSLPHDFPCTTAPVRCKRWLASVDVRRPPYLSQALTFAKSLSLESIAALISANTSGGVGDEMEEVLISFKA